MQATIHKADNLNILKKLPDNTIDLIYCDILYGTGRNFGDYQDLKADRKIIEEHYEPRLIEMYRVLKNTGSIYLQMDTRINHWMRCLMDDVFGYDNFRNEIIWQYSKSIKNVSNKNINNHDNIYHYTVSSDYTFNPQIEKYTEKQLSRFNKIDDIGKFYYDTRRDKNGNKKKVKVRLTKKGTPVGDVWYFNFVQGKERLNYPTQKPKALLERIIKASSNEGDLVADFYAGSHTTGEVALELGRRYIGVDIGERSYEIGQERLKKWL